MEEKKVTRFETEHGFSSYNSEEMAVYVEVINKILANDVDCAGKYVPVNPETEEIFEKVGDGVIFCKLVNAIQPKTIDERCINKKMLNVFKIKENLNLAISSGKGIGLNITSMHPEMIMDKNKTQILAFMAQLIRAHILADINSMIMNNPYLYRLKKPDEEMEAFLSLGPEEMLLRWFNFHLTEGKTGRSINNFHGDLKDGANYALLLNQLAPEKADLSGMDMDPASRAAKVIKDGSKMNVPAIIKPKDILDGNNKINLIYCAQIYNAIPFGGLEPKVPVEDNSAQEALKQAREKVSMEEDNSSGSREERSLLNWANSQGIDGWRIRNPNEDLSDGLFLLKLIDKLKPGSVNWKRTEQKPNMKIKKITNCNYAVELCKEMGLSLPGTGGVDIVDGNRKLILGVLWQLMRKSVMQLIGDKSEEDLRKWANDFLGDKEPKIASYQDKHLKNSRFFLNLLDKVQPDSIDWEIYKEGESDEVYENNARYCISVARKFGATVYLVWEDIKDLNKRLLVCFIAAIAKVAAK